MIAAAMVASFGWVGSAGAMQFSTIPLDNPDKVVIVAVGEIIAGDLDRLVAHLRTLGPQVQVVGFSLDSPGGSVVEAEKIAEGMHQLKTTVGVLGQSRCVSACFLIFAAGSNKMAEATALIGVHSASEAGTENATTMAITTAMARDAADFGVPLAIIGKMVTTTPGQMQWLTRKDLVSMGVEIIQPNVPAPGAVSREQPRADAPPDDAAVPAVASQGSMTFQQGLTDRQGWEQWFGALSGRYLEGASFWAAHRGDARLPSCNGAGGVAVAPFTAGCQAAQKRLSASDVRRKADADYRRGWNSY